MHGLGAVPTLTAIETSWFDMTAETILAKLNELRHEAEDDKTDLEYVALHHAFCFISFKMGEFQKYLDEVTEGGDAT